jgi:hypothetical protein
MKVRVDVAGDRDVTDSLRRLGAAGPVVAKRVLARFTERVVPQARAICPVDQPPDVGGEMRDSIRATRPTLTGAGRVSAGVVAGATGRSNPDSYVEQQHEDLTLQHTVGQGKFVEIPFLREAPKVPEELLAEIDKEANLAR